MINYKHPDYYRLHLDQPETPEANAAYHTAFDAFLDAIERRDDDARNAAQAQIRACINAGVIRIDRESTEYDRWRARHGGKP